MPDTDRQRQLARQTTRNAQLRGFLATEDLSGTDRRAITGELEASREYAAELLDGTDDDN